MPKLSGSWRKSLLGAIPTPTPSVNPYFSLPLFCVTWQHESSQEAPGDAGLGQTPHIYFISTGKLVDAAVSPLNCLMTLIECVLAMCRALRLLGHQTEPAALFFKVFKVSKEPQGHHELELRLPDVNERSFEAGLPLPGV